MKNKLKRSLLYQYKSRRLKKRVLNKKFITKINSFSYLTNNNYNLLIALKKKHNIYLNKKILSELAFYSPKTFLALNKFLNN